jgi:hypothetical protein
MLEKQQPVSWRGEYISLETDMANFEANVVCQDERRCEPGIFFLEGCKKKGGIVGNMF